MCVRSSGPGISESTLHSKPLVIALAHLYGCWSLNERGRQMDREIKAVFKPERAASDVFRRNCCKHKQQLHVRVTLRELRTEESHFSCSSCLSSVLNLHMFLSLLRGKEQTKQDRKTRGRGCDRSEKNQCSRGIVGFILTDQRTVCDDEKFEGKQPIKIPWAAKKHKTLSGSRHTVSNVKCLVGSWTTWLWMHMNGTLVSFITWLIRAAYWAKPKTAEA